MDKNDFIKLTASTILEKDFQIEFRGYKVEEVDQFLDKIKDDYEVFEIQANKAAKEIARLKTEVNSLKESLNKMQELYNEANERLNKYGEAGELNAQMLKRISNLEKGR